MNKISISTSVLKRTQKVLAANNRKDLAEIIAKELNKGVTGTPKKAMDSNVAKETRTVKEAREKMANNNDGSNVKKTNAPKSKTEREVKKMAKKAVSTRKVRKGKKSTLEKQYAARQRTPYSNKG